MSARTGEGQVAPIKRTKELKELVELSPMEKKKLMVGWRGTSFNDLFLEGDNVEEEMAGEQQQQRQQGVVDPSKLFFGCYLYLLKKSV